MKTAMQLPGAANILHFEVCAVMMSYDGLLDIQIIHDVNHTKNQTPSVMQGRITPWSWR
jgi:hypothetical protein